MSEMENTNDYASTVSLTYGDFIRAFDENIELRKRVEELENVEREHMALLALMRKAEKIAMERKHEEERPRFRMDANGNLTRIEEI